MLLIQAMTQNEGLNIHAFIDLLIESKYKTKVKKALSCIDASDNLNYKR